MPLTVAQSPQRRPLMPMTKSAPEMRPQPLPLEMNAIEWRSGRAYSPKKYPPTPPPVAVRKVTVVWTRKLQSLSVPWVSTYWVPAMPPPSSAPRRRPVATDAGTPLWSGPPRSSQKYTPTGAAAPSVDGLLAVKGVIEIVEPEAGEAETQVARAAAAAAFDEALRSLIEMRRREGETLGRVLAQRLDEIERLAGRCEAAPGRKPEAVRARLAEQVAALLETSDRFDSDRLSQEAIMIAAKADIREELDRIASHVAQARDLLGKGGAVGRRLDFLAQEFNREVNTCCSKSNDLELTNLGLEMKTVVEQFREQVQNLE